MKDFLTKILMIAVITITASAFAQDTELVLNEYSSNPNGTDNVTRSEWFELYNRGNTAVDLSGYLIKSNGTVSHDRVVTAGISIPAKGYLVFVALKDVFTGNTYRRMDSNIIVDMSWPRTSVLSNTNTAIRIYRPGETTPFISTAIVKTPIDNQSVELNDPSLPMVSENYTLCPLIYGTPGRPNLTLNTAGVTITGGLRNIQYPSPSDSITISATVNAANPSPTIAAVELMVDSGSGYVANPMTNNGSGNYSYTLSGIADETLIKHYVKVTDSNGNFVTQPPTAAPEAFFVDDNFPTDQDLVINEIMYNPIGGDNGGRSEWIEVYNRRSTPINMSFYLWGNHTETTNARLTPEGFTIPGNGYVILAGNSLLFTLQYPAITVPISNASWNDSSVLANSNTDQDTPLVHTNAVDWNDTRIPFEVVPFRVISPWPTSSDGFSIQLINPALDNTQGETWVKTSAIGQETPGAANNVSSVQDWSVY